MTLYKHAALQIGLALLAFTMWTAADSWYLLTKLPLAEVLSVITAVIAGLTIGTVVHEWGHLAGAHWSSSSYAVAKKFGFFVYDFDFENNTMRQFNLMSLGGQLGSWLTIVALFLLIPMDNSGRVMLVGGAFGGAVFGGIIEWPVLRRAQESREPLQELKKIDRAIFKRSSQYAAISVLAFWLLMG
jgi:hypothetical protein